MYTRVRTCVPGHNSARNFAALLTRGELPRWKRGSPLSARIYRLSYEEENFGREIFDFEVVCGKFLQSLERSCRESRRKESLVIVGEISNFDLDENPLRILREWVEVDSREAKLFELSSRAFWTFPLIGGGIGLARGRSIKCRILCQRGRGRCNVFNVRRSSTIPPCLPW